MVFHRSRICPVSRQYLIISRMTCAISCWAWRRRWYFSVSSSSSLFWLCGPGAKRDLYIPRCRPDGDVDVVSFHVVIFPRNSCSVIIAGRTSSSEAALHDWRMADNCGISLKLTTVEPARMSLQWEVLAGQLIVSQNGSRVKGVPEACPKWDRLRSCKKYSTSSGSVIVVHSVQVLGSSSDLVEVMSENGGGQLVGTSIRSNFWVAPWCMRTYLSVCHVCRRASCLAIFRRIFSLLFVPSAFDWSIIICCSRARSSRCCWIVSRSSVFMDLCCCHDSGRVSSSW